MKENEISSAFDLSRLSPDRKIFVLSLLTHNLTISGRAIYSDHRAEAATLRKFYTLNEILHKVSSQLMHLASKDGAAEPDDVFVESLYTLAREGECEVELHSALKYSLS